MRYQPYYRITLTALLAFTSFFSQAQRKDSNNTSAIPVTDSTVEDRLIALALKSPLYLKSEHENKIDAYKLKKVKESWLNLLTVSTNYNINSNRGTNAGNIPVVYPRNSFGLNVPLGIIFSKGSDIKIAREMAILGNISQEQLRREIKVDILTKYKQYVSYAEMIRMQNKVIDDEQAAVLQTEKKFREGTTTIEAYNSIMKNLNNDMAEKQKLQLAQDILKLEIEAIIGVDLNSVLRK